MFTIIPSSLPVSRPPSSLLSIFMTFKPLHSHINSVLFLLSLHAPSCFPFIHPSFFPSSRCFCSNMKPPFGYRDKTELTPPESFPWVLPLKWILTQPLLIPHYPFIAFFHLFVHAFIPGPSVMTGLSADMNQLREKIPHYVVQRLFQEETMWQIQMC